MSVNSRDARRLSARLLIGLAGVVFLVLYGAALWRGDALIYAAGAVAAVGVLAPLWWQRPRYLLLGLIFYLPVEDALVGAFLRNQTVARVVPDIFLFAAFAFRIIQSRRR